MRTRLGSHFGMTALLLLCACSADNTPTDEQNSTAVSPTTGSDSVAVGPVGTTSVGPVSSAVNPTTTPATTTGPTGTTAVSPQVGPTASAPTTNVAPTTGNTTTATSTAPDGSQTETTDVPVNPQQPIVRPSLVTSGPGAYWTVGEVTEAPGAATDLTVDVATVHQTWLGFGGSFNEQGWDALTAVSAADQDRAMKLLFDKAEGAALEFGRIPIGASDYALERYTLNDTADDYEMTMFSIEPDRALLIPYIKAALAINPNVRLWASPWTPPAWMKTNGKLDGTSKRVDNSTVDNLPDAEMKGEGPVLDAFALYLARFVEEYEKEGIPIESIMPQNEPGYATRYPSCLWSADVMRTFIGDHLGPLFTERGIDAEIWFGTMSNADAGKDGTLLSAITGDTKAMSYIKGFGLQWNMISYVGDLMGRDLPILQTEHKCGNYPWESGTFNAEQPPNDHAYGQESWGLIRDWLKAGVNSYSAWNMVLDKQGKNLDFDRPWPQNALLVVDRATGTLAVTSAYYAFRHVSYFVEPGAKRVATNADDALAFTNPDGSVVAIVHNAGGSPKSTTLGIGDTRLQFQVPAQGWATVNWKP